MRTACALAALTGLSCRIQKVRVGRRQPGLRAQHRSVLKGLRAMCGATTSDFKLGATEITFSPGPLRPGEIKVDTGTAGSIGLVLQGLLLAALGSEEPFQMVVRGGTDVPGAPGCDYVEHVQLPLLKKMGYRVDIRTIRRGYYPRGGGIVEVETHPFGAGLLKPLLLPEGGEVLGSVGISHAAAVLKPREVAEQQKRFVSRTLTDYLHAPAKIALEYGETDSVGSGLLIWARTTESVFGGAALARKGGTPHQVAEEASQKLLRTYHARSALDPWMGDQILPYMALSEGPSVVSVPTLTRHMRTNMWVIENFLNVRFHCEQQDEGVRVHCRPMLV